MKKYSSFKTKSYNEKIASLKVKQAKARKSVVKPKKPAKGQNKPKKGKSRPPTKAVRVKKLKKKLWPIFSRYIRLKYADHTGWTKTSDGEYAFWKETDCGHLWHNSDRNSLLGGNELWFYENNFAPQSQAGNRFNKDDSAKKYMGWAIEKYGKKEVDKMYKLKQTYKLWTEEELEEKYQFYKSEVDRMMI